MLCRGSIPFSKGETSSFRSHLQHHHGIFYHYDVIISVNVISRRFLTKIVEEFEQSGERSDFVGLEEEVEEIVELDEASDAPKASKYARLDVSVPSEPIQNENKVQLKFSVLC